MTHDDDLFVDDREARAAWQALCDDDRQACAPAHLERRVLEAVAASRREISRRGRRHIAWMGLAAALAMAVAAGVWAGGRRNDRAPLLAATPLAWAGTLAATPLRVSPAPPAAPAPRIARASRTPRTLPPPLVTLSIDPLRDGEVLQLVRLRLPREALQAFGLALLAHDSGAIAHDAGIVDVDLLVGEDGLPRDIRRIRAVQE